MSILRYVQLTNIVYEIVNQEARVIVAIGYFSHEAVLNVVSLPFVSYIIDSNKTIIPPKYFTQFRTKPPNGLTWTTIEQ